MNTRPLGRSRPESHRESGQATTAASEPQFTHGANATLDIIALARRVDPNLAAVREWFFETPISPYGKTAFELTRAGRTDAVVAFLTRVLHDSAAASRLSDGTPATGNRASSCAR